MCRPSGLWRYDHRSGVGVKGDPRQQAQLAICRRHGYPDAPSSSTVYYGNRGIADVPGYGMVDMNYNIPIVGSVRP